MGGELSGRKIPSVILLLAGLLAGLLAAPLSAAPTLFYFEAKDDGCHWRLRRTDAVRDHHVTKGCPEPGTVVFDPPAKRTLYALGGELYELRWGGEAVSIEASLPDDAARAYREDPTPLELSLFVSPFGVLSAVYLAPVEEGDPDYDDSHLPEWGSPYFAVVAELGPDGFWERVARVPTKAEAGETPGLSLVDHHRTGARSVSLADLLRRATCRARDCSAKAQGVKAPEALLKRLGLKSGDEAGHRDGFLFKVRHGDTPHASPPVLHLRSEKNLVEAGRHSQLSLSTSDNLLLVTEEYSGAHPRVFSAEGKLLFESPGASGAAWLPFPL